MDTASREETPQPGRTGRKPWGFRIVVALVILGGAAWGVRYYRYAQTYESTDDAFIEGTVVQIAPQVAGQVLQVAIEDNQRVKQGDLLVEIDPKPYLIRLDAQRAAAQVAESRRATAERKVELTRATTAARLEEAESALNAAKAVAEEARSGVVAAEAEAQRAQKDAERYTQLVGGNAVSQQQHDLASTTARAATARLLEARKQVAAADAQVGQAEGGLAAAKTGPQEVALAESQREQSAAEVAQAEAAVRAAALDLEHTKILAPLDGHVTKKSVHVGEIVQIGQALTAVVSPAVWVVANFKETQLRRMRTGQEVRIRVDAFPQHVFRGHIDSMQAGSGARFSLLPPENATGNYVKVIQRVPVKILFDEPLPADRAMAPGMSVVPEVRIK